MILSELSEDHACAGWLIDLEYLVWTSVVEAGAEIIEHDTFGLGRLDSQRRFRARGGRESRGWLGRMGLRVPCASIPEHGDVAQQIRPVAQGAGPARATSVSCVSGPTSGCS